MEHYKSTLGTTAAAISALVLAAQIMQAGPFTVSPPRAERVPATIETSAEETAWVNPPVRTLAEAKPDAAQAATEAAKSGDVPVLGAPAVAAAQAAARGEAAPAPRKAVAPHRRKVAQRPARTRQATLETRTATETAASQATQQQPQPAEAKRTDPIGDIIRGLGFGGGQG